MSHDVTARIARLFVYPIKSCAGIEVQEALLTDTGLDLDRAWMVVDAQGEFVTQRELPRMALVQPKLRGSEVVLRAPGMRTFNFHPMLVYLNARTMTPYRTVRSSVPKLDALDETAARPHVNEGIGVGTTLAGLLDAIDPARTQWLKELR